MSSQPPGAPPPSLSRVASTPPSLAELIQALLGSATSSSSAPPSKPQLPADSLLASRGRVASRSSPSPPLPPLAPLPSPHSHQAPPSGLTHSVAGHPVGQEDPTTRPSGQFSPHPPIGLANPVPGPATRWRKGRRPPPAPSPHLQPGSSPTPPTPPPATPSAPSVAAGSVSTEGSTKAVIKIQEQLSLILESLGDTQERLTAIETSIQQCQSDITSGQQEIAELRGLGDQRHNRPGHDIRAVDAKPGRLPESFAGTRGELTMVQKAVSGTDKLVSILSEAVKIAQDQLLDFDRRTQSTELGPAAQPASLAPQARLLKMEESINQTQNRLLVVEKSSSRVQDDLSVVQRLVGTHSHLLLTARGSGPSGVSTENELDQRVPAAEVKAGELEKSLEETKKDVSSIRKYLRAMDRQAPIMEGKVDKLEKVVGEVRLSLDSVGGQVAGLGMRVTAIEANTSALIDASETTDAYDAVRRALGGSPAVYPSQGSDYGLDGSPPLRLRELSPSPS